MDDAGQDLSLWNILVGEVAGTHGLAGEIKVAPTTDFEERFAAGKTLCVEGADGKRRLETIRSSRWHQQYVLLKFEGYEDRTAGEALRKARLFITEKMMLPLPEGRYYVKDLLGMIVETTEGEHVGPVEDVLETGSNDVYVTPRGLIPATRE
ncbi:MAG: 16S rRNA processing protein RimM, partial [Armatimonadetes bacterium]|nr:16S rRNA processing protein RimM [Armatimonadota bacterium]